MSNLDSLKEKYVEGIAETYGEILGLLKSLVELYPRHIQKEDEQFFFPSMEYFTKQEKEDMLEMFIEFDSKFTNSRYEKVIEALEEKLGK